MMPKPPALYINSHKFTHAYMLMAPTTETHIFQVQVQSQQAHIEAFRVKWPVVVAAASEKHIVFIATVKRVLVVVSID